MTSDTIVAMGWRKRAAGGIVIMILCAGLALAEEPDPKQLVERANAVLRGSSNHAEFTMTVEGGPTLHKVYEMEGWNRGATEAKVLIHSPTAEKDSAALRSGKDLWMFMPNIARVVRIPATMMHQPWMGSDFNYEDIVKADSIVGSYDHRILSREKAEGHEVFMVESVPHADAPVVWGKVLLRIRQDTDGTVMLVREEDYSERGQVIRSIDFSEIEVKDGRRVPTRLECIPQPPTGRHTVIKYREIDFDVTFADDFFGTNSLRR